MMTLALMLLQAVAATPTDAQERDVIVTGVPRGESERGWRACMARGCPPDEEAAAALLHAENQFVGGDYQGAKTTLPDDRSCP